MDQADTDALFQRWLAEHGGAVWKVARAYTHSAEDGQDLAQEILLQVWRSLPQFQGKSSAATWVYRIALNTALAWRRKERQTPRRAADTPVEEIPAQCAPGASPAEDRELVEQLYSAIRQLPKTDAALVLMYLEDLSYRQMAEVLGISESNVGVKLNRAKAALKKVLEGRGA